VSDADARECSRLIKFRPTTSDAESQHHKTHSRLLECDVCSKRFASRYDLNRHVTSHRVGLAKFRCDIRNCNFATTRKDNLAQHKRNRHAGYPTHPIAETSFVGRPANSNTDNHHDSAPQDDSDEVIQAQIWRVMMSAASTGDVLRLAYLLQRRLDVNMKADDGYTALHCAARAGQVAAVRYLLENGADINASNEQAKLREPLYEAVLGRHAAVVTVLLEAGADLWTDDGKGQSIIDCVASSNDVELAQALLHENRGQIIAEDVASRLAESATRSDKHTLLNWLLSTYPGITPYSTKLNKSLLNTAAIAGKMTTFELLLSASKTMSSSNATG